MLSIHWHQPIFEVIVEVVEICCEYITFLGSFVLICSVLIATVNIVLACINVTFGTTMSMVLSEKRGVASIANIRLQMGEVAALRLGILVVSDVLETLTKLETETYSWNALGKIGELFFVFSQ